MDGKGLVQPIVPETLNEEDYGKAFPESGNSNLMWSRIKSEEDYKVRIHHDSKTLATDNVFIEISAKGRDCWLA
jgi:hypothetical protein